jgi:ferredoxin-type protein NapH
MSELGEFNNRADALATIEKLHHLSLSAGVWSWRYLILRRMVQLGILLLFFGTAHWAWEYPEKVPLLAGNLSASELMGLIPMTDPFAALQIFLTGHVLQPESLMGVAVLMGFYLLVSGRVFCAWVCPVNMVTDLAGWLRNRIGITPIVHVPRTLRYFILVATLVLTVITGMAAFEWVSPIGMMHREIIFGLGMGFTALIAIFLFDLLILKNGWCGHLCPLGAFWSVVGKVGLVRVRFNRDTCTHCGECARVCPEPQVLNLKRLDQVGMVYSGECSNCGRCTALCPEGSLRFDLRALTGKHRSDA